MIRKEQLYEQILEQIDLTKETDDEELQELIRTVLDEAADEEYISLSDKIRIGRELFNSFRKLDVLQELLEDDSITEIMVNGIDHIFYEKEGRIFRFKKCFLSQERLLDVIQQIVGESNRYVNEASPIVDARLKDGSRVNVVLNPVAVNGPTNRDLIGMYDANTRIRKEYGQMVRKLDLNLSVVTVLNEFAAEVKQEDVTNFITVYAAAKVSGGDSIAIIRDAARTIGEKIDTEREIQTMLAAKKLEFEIMSVIPFIMIFYMKMTFGEFLSVLYGTWTGCIVMSICLVLYLGAYRFGRRLLQIEI